jgi:hypothetical protein
MKSDEKQQFPQKQFTFTGLHIVISQKTELFIVVVVRTSNPTSYRIHYNYRKSYINIKAPAGSLLPPKFHH